jgi:Holliday junction resolvasome RuvABC DNA-binding subunit
MDNWEKGFNEFRESADAFSEKIISESRNRRDVRDAKNGNWEYLKGLGYTQQQIEEMANESQ